MHEQTGTLASFLKYISHQRMNTSPLDTRGWFSHSGPLKEVDQIITSHLAINQYKPSEATRIGEGQHGAFGDHHDCAIAVTPFLGDIYQASIFYLPH